MSVGQAWVDWADPWAAPWLTTPRPGGLAGWRLHFAQPRRVLSAAKPQDVRAVIEAVQVHSATGGWAVGLIRYEAAPAFDPTLPGGTSDGPLAWFALYDTAQPWAPDAPPTLTTGRATAPTAPTGATAAPDCCTSAVAPTADSALPTVPRPGALVTGVMPRPTQPAMIDWRTSLNRPDFDRRVAAIHAAIASGACYQINLTHPVQADAPNDLNALAQRLLRAQPGGYSLVLDTGDEQIISVSPELFFDWDGQRLLTRPMKGTAPRSADADTDARAAQALRASPKERAENVMIVDLLRNDCARVALPHSVHVPHLFALQALPTAWQMVSDVTAMTRPGTTLWDVLAALFPCGSVTGAPKRAAMQRIAALEDDVRGVYCGALGVVAPGGAARFSVAIRTVSARAGRLRCGIGSGITADAQAEAEWVEWRVKRGFLQRAAAEFDLLETLRLQDGRYPHRDWHTQRLARSATHFGYPLDALATATALDRAAQAHPQGLWRVRLRVRANAAIVTEVYAQNEAPAQVFIALAATHFEAFDSEFTRHKTTQRQAYAAYAPSQAGVWDTALYNPFGELTEGTFGNLAFCLDGTWVTPPLRCGLLPGVARARALTQGWLREAVVRLDDLPRVRAMAWGNALRGWIPAQWVHQSAPPEAPGLPVAAAD